MNILLVDDDPSVLEFYSGVLQENFPSATITCAEDGGQALRLCGDHNFSLIVTDYKMPILDGIAFIEILRTSHTVNKKAPIVLLSGFLTHIDVTIVELFDVQKLEKPVSTAQFVNLCTDLISVA